MVSFRNMLVFRQLWSAYSYFCLNAVMCLYTEDVIFMDNVQKLYIAFNS